MKKLSAQLNKAFCSKTKKEYMVHRNTHLCPVCQNEPVIWLWELGTKEETIKREEFAKKWKTRFCIVCGKKINTFYSSGKKMVPSQYLKKNYCCDKCRKRKIKEKFNKRREGLKTKHCVICGKPISKNIMSPAQYKKRKICNNKECAKEFSKIKGSKWRNPYEDLSTAMKNKFSKIDERY